MKKTIPLIPFYFIRHGQTEWNRLGIRQGQTDIPLNDDGIAQAQSIVSTLSGKGISRIVSSPLMRAHKTAVIINEHLSVPLHLADGLKECHFGVLEGTAKSCSIFSTNWATGTPIEKGEHVDEFKARVANALHAALDPKHTTLIVAHGGVYWAIMEMIGFKEQFSDNCALSFCSSHRIIELLDGSADWVALPLVHLFVRIKKLRLLTKVHHQYRHHRNGPNLHS